MKVLLLWISVVASALTTAAATRTPNFVIIFCDDLGYGDLGCYGHPSIRTPNIDRLASEGMRFTDFYSGAEVCTPSRAALMTGRYPVRTGMCGDKRRVFHANATKGLEASEVTLAEALQEKGYATACIGKWHLGNKPEYNPTRHGFDYFFGLPHSNDMNPTTNAPRPVVARLDQQASWWRAPLYRNNEVIEQATDQTQLTKRYTQESVRFIKENHEKRFFLYVAHTFPHVPLFASAEFHGKSPRGLYGDVVEEIDWSTGEIMKALRDAGLDSNTLVVFTSDNGPWLTQKQAGGSAGLLREGKGSTWEGGMRVPFIAHWPGQIPAGRTETALTCNMDLFPTFIALAGAEMPKERPIDGLDFTPVLLGKGSGKRDSFAYYRGMQLYAMRHGPWKAHFTTKPGYGPQAAQQHDPPLLFHLGHDPSEQFNVAAANPEVLAEIKKRVERHRNNVQPRQSLVDLD
jgi:arylsulfatase A-like enzyme